jgi:D-3-phosphoglycerate dehydrogenase
MRILVSDPVDDEAIALLGKEHDVLVREFSPKDLLQAIPEYDALVVRSSTAVTKEVLRAGRKLKVVGRAGVGVDNIDVAAATGLSIPVVYAPAATTTSVAELTLGLMLSLARSIPEADRSMKEGRWEKKRFEGVELRGKVLGLIGSGRIGSEVARLALALGMEAQAYDPYLSPEAARKRGLRLRDSLDTLLETSDFVSIHASLTPETRRMIDERRLRLMKPSAYLINAARGEIVDEEALAKALREGWIAGAGLDVYEVEPPNDSPLISLDGVVLTPHIAASTAEGQRRAGLVTAEQVLKVLRGEKPEFCVNPEVLEGG